MKRLLWTMPLVMGLLGATSVSLPASAAAKKPPAKSAKTAKKAAVMYECKMCNVKNAKGGKCPDCGMEMTKVAAKTDKKTPAKKPGKT